jgi:hypothetical protein
MQVSSHSFPANWTQKLSLLLGAAFAESKVLLHFYVRFYYSLFQIPAVRDQPWMLCKIKFALRNVCLWMDLFIISPLGLCFHFGYMRNVRKIWTCWWCLNMKCAVTFVINKRILADLIDMDQLINSMEQSPSSKANRSSASQISRILWNPKVHCRFHKSPLPVPIPNQMDPVQTSVSYFLKIYLNIVFQVVSFLRVSPAKPCMHLSFWPSHSGWDDPSWCGLHKSFCGGLCSTLSSGANDKWLTILSEL